MRRSSFRAMSIVASELPSSTRITRLTRSCGNSRYVISSVRAALNAGMTTTTFGSLTKINHSSNQFTRSRRSDDRDSEGQIESLKKPSFECQKSYQRSVNPPREHVNRSFWSGGVLPDSLPDPECQDRQKHCRDEIARPDDVESADCQLVPQFVRSVTAAVLQSLIVL